MRSILTDPIAIDTNVYIYSVVSGSTRPACEAIIFEHIHKLRILLPGQVIREIHGNLRQKQLDSVYSALDCALFVDRRGSHVEAKLIEKYEALGAKKGDAVIAAELEAAEVKWLISENRHFLTEIEGLPFTVLSAEQALGMLLASKTEAGDANS